ncbi:unnamed protein product [Phytomonas sp. Hart1]|nr:unnamed protein product [Phytomonas sp. Hart1]|eukprot:CCW66406.1 unnamed protein product [Phytomonas sp. isolate Hart1]
MPYRRRSPFSKRNHKPTQECLPSYFPQFIRNRFMGPSGNVKGDIKSPGLRVEKVQQDRTTYKDKWWTSVAQFIKYVDSPRNFNLDCDDNAKGPVTAKRLFRARPQDGCHSQSPPYNQVRRLPNPPNRQGMGQPVHLENRSITSYNYGVYEFGEVKVQHSLPTQDEDKAVMAHETSTNPPPGSVPECNESSGSILPDTHKDSTPPDLVNVMPCFRTGTDLHAFVWDANEYEIETGTRTPPMSISKSSFAEQRKISSLYGSSVNNVPDFQKLDSKEPNNDSTVGEELLFRPEDDLNNKDTHLIEEKGISSSCKIKTLKLNSVSNLAQSFSFMEQNHEGPHILIQTPQSVVDGTGINGLCNGESNRPPMPSTNVNELEPHDRETRISVSSTTTTASLKPKSKLSTHVEQNSSLNSPILQISKDSFPEAPCYDFDSNIGCDELQTIHQGSKHLVHQLDKSCPGSPLCALMSPINALMTYSIEGSHVLSPQTGEVACVKMPPANAPQETNITYGNPIKAKHSIFRTGDEAQTQALSTSVILPSDKQLNEKIDASSISHLVALAKVCGARQYAKKKLISTSEEVNGISSLYKVRAVFFDKNMKLKAVTSNTNLQDPNIGDSSKERPCSAHLHEVVIPKENTNTSETLCMKDNEAVISKVSSPSNNAKPRKGSAMESGNSHNIETAECNNNDSGEAIKPNGNDKSVDRGGKIPYAALLPVLLFEITKAGQCIRGAHKALSEGEQKHILPMNINRSKACSPIALKSEGHSSFKETFNQTSESPSLPPFLKQNHFK